jgi:hypothetical protein
MPRFAPTSTLTIAVLALLVATPVAGAARSGNGALSPRLTDLVSLDRLSLSRAEEARALSLPASGPGSLLRSGGQVLVEVRFEEGARVEVDAVRAAGARIVHVSPRYATVTAAASPASLPRVAGIPGVQSVTEVLAPSTSESDGGSALVSESLSGCQGATTSEGDTQLRADEARRTFGVDGRGVKVGVLSDSFDRDGNAPTRASQDVASGDLPGPGNPCKRRRRVEILDDSAGGTDEGRAMLQIVHDLAPGASLAFATAFNGELDFADNIRALRAAGARVIVDDFTYFDEPFFQDGPLSVAVNDVTASGAAYYSSAANYNVVSGGADVGSLEAPAFRPSGSCPAGLSYSYTTDCMDFDPGEGVDNTYGISVAPGRTVKVDLQWAQPWNGVTTDLDAYLLSSTNTVLAHSENSNVTVTQKPFEFLAWSNPTLVTQHIDLAINRYTAADGGDLGTPRLKFLFPESGPTGVVPTEYTSSNLGDVVGPAIFGHNGAANAMSIAAVPFDDSSQVEPYSSRGPLALYYGPVDGVTPAPAITPQRLDKPDIAATDCGVTTFFASFDGTGWRFCGTSASAPHAAAIAALQYEVRPSATFAQVHAAETSTAAPVDSFGHEAAGAGLIYALGAVGSLAEP